MRKVDRDVPLPKRWCAGAQRERRYTELVRRPTAEESEHADAVLKRALAKQASDTDHDLGLIVERLSWTPEERLEANSAFLRFYHAVRPNGPLIDEE